MSNFLLCVMFACTSVPTTKKASLHTYILYDSYIIYIYYIILYTYILYMPALPCEPDTALIVPQSSHERQPVQHLLEPRPRTQPLVCQLEDRAAVARGG
eukprot:SAG25_NODE_87_length_16363_cov_40.489179_11_plen_99_part_00